MSKLQKTSNLSISTESNYSATSDINQSGGGLFSFLYSDDKASTITQLCLEAFADKQPYVAYYLLDNALKNNVCINFKLKDDSGKTLLHYLVLYCTYSPNIKQLLIDCMRFSECRKYINEQDNLLNTPAHYAVYLDEQDIIKYLAECGANLKLKNSKGYHISPEIVYDSVQEKVPTQSVFTIIEKPNPTEYDDLNQTLKQLLGQYVRSSDETQSIGFRRDELTETYADTNVDVDSEVYFKNLLNKFNGDVPFPKTSVPKSTSQPDRQPVSQPNRQPVSQPNRQPVSQPNRQPVSQPNRQPVSQPNRQPVSQPNRQPVSQPDRQPVSQPDRQPVSNLIFQKSSEDTDKYINSLIKDELDYDIDMTQEGGRAVSGFRRLVTDSNVFIGGSSEDKSQKKSHKKKLTDSDSDDEETDDSDSDDEETDDSDSDDEETDDSDSDDEETDDSDSNTKKIARLARNINIASEKHNIAIQKIAKFLNKDENDVEVRAIKAIIYESVKTDKPQSSNFEKAEELEKRASDENFISNIDRKKIKNMVNILNEKQQQKEISDSSNSSVESKKFKKNDKKTKKN